MVSRTDLIQPQEKFAIISFSSDRCGELSKSGLFLSQEVFCLPHSPLQLDKSWKKDIGRLTCENIENGGLFLCSRKHSDKPEIFDGENDALEQEVLHLRWGILLLGMPRSQSQHLISGAHEGETSKVRSHSELNMIYYIPDQGSLTITLDVLRRAFNLGKKREEIYKKKESHSRFKRGLYALYRSFEEDDMNRRFHELVRSIEAIILPRRGKTTEDFEHRCSLFTRRKAKGEVVQIFKEIYDTRSKSEHMHHYTDALPQHPIPYREKIALLRLRQLDALARFVYLRILDDSAVLDCFGREQNIVSLWKRSDDELRKIWNSDLDITTIS